jgi:DNA (cytosine-5)-methyltransferase 1
MPTFYEFFAGGGMARAGLGTGWQCLFANDIDEKKGRSYCDNWGDSELLIRDVAKVETTDVSMHADVAWASFPCQDLSLAGAGAGLEGNRSGTFWPFWDLLRRLAKEGRAPRLIVLENVCGALTSHGGRDFGAIASAFSGLGYRFGAVVADAVDFLPQSRPRLFIIGVSAGYEIPAALIGPGPIAPWHTDALQQAYGSLSGRAQAKWLWWRLPLPPAQPLRFADLIEDNPRGVEWHTADETKRLISMMSEVNHAKLEAAKSVGRRMVGTLYRRTRKDDEGKSVQRAEVRFDDIAGCLRTPTGGSSRQTIVVVEGRRVRSRLLSPRETARLMGLPETYQLPPNYNDCYHLTGDGVAVPVVRFLAENILEPILAAAEIREVA